VLKVDLVVVAIESPLLIGIYENGDLIEKIEVEGQTSENLPVHFEKILEKYRVERVLFANGPGSFMAIKINYIFLKTLSTVLGIELFGIDAFFFNGNHPIKAIGGMCFVKTENVINLEKIENFMKMPFYLPEKFDISLYSKDIEPLYILPAI
jgi:tRNA threonylcarbamoyladenosine biosynthesis protein TsaB